MNNLSSCCGAPLTKTGFFCYGMVPIYECEKCLRHYDAVEPCSPLDDPATRVVKKVEAHGAPDIRDILHEFAMGYRAESKKSRMKCLDECIAKLRGSSDGAVHNHSAQGRVLPYGNAAAAASSSGAPEGQVKYWAVCTCLQSYGGEKPPCPIHDPPQKVTTTTAPTGSSVEINLGTYTPSPYWKGVPAGVGMRFVDNTQNSSPSSGAPEDKNGHRIDDSGKLVFDERCCCCDPPTSKVTNEPISNDSEEKCNYGAPEEREREAMQKIEEFWKPVWKSVPMENHTSGDTKWMFDKILSLMSSNEELRKENDKLRIPPVSKLSRLIDWLQEYVPLVFMGLGLVAGIGVFLAFLKIIIWFLLLSFPLQ